MNRYIDADKAIKEIIAERDDGSLDGEYKDGFIDGMSTAAKILDERSAADVVEVVRCGECRHYVRSEGVCKLHSNNYEPTVAMEEDDYCSRGRRK